jgi:hypothetical protein
MPQEQNKKESSRVWKNLAIKSDRLLTSDLLGVVTRSLDPYLKSNEKESLPVRKAYSQVENPNVYMEMAIRVDNHKIIVEIEHDKPFSEKKK